MNLFTISLLQSKNITLTKSAYHLCSSIYVSLLPPRKKAPIRVLFCVADVECVEKICARNTRPGQICVFACKMKALCRQANSRREKPKRLVEAWFRIPLPPPRKTSVELFQLRFFSYIRLSASDMHFVRDMSFGRDMRCAR